MDISSRPRKHQADYGSRDTSKGRVATAFNEAVLPAHEFAAIRREDSKVPVEESIALANFQSFQHAGILQSLLDCRRRGYPNGDGPFPVGGYPRANRKKLALLPLHVSEFTICSASACEESLRKSNSF
jgi:hypothetical protein